MDDGHDAGEQENGEEGEAAVRPISLLRLSLLRFVHSKLPGNSLWT